MAKARAKKKKTQSAKKAPSKKMGGKKKVRVSGDKGTIRFFMGQLITAGYLGEEIPEESGQQNKAAQRLRQMSEKLARQLRKFGGEDGEEGSEAVSDGDDDDEGEVDGDGEE